MAEKSQTFRAIRLHTPGDASELRLEATSFESPRAGEALVRVEFAGVNFIDVYKRTGLYKVPLPATLGEEGSGIVAAVGDGVTEVKEGDRVAWATILGAYAEYAIVPSAKLVPVPDAVTLRDAAALMLQGMTAHYLTHSTFPLEAGDRCLVHAAAGGVGLLLVQIAKRCGAFVIGTAGTDEKAQLAREAGADEVIVYTRDDFVTEVKRITRNEGVNVVYDSVGKTTFLPGLSVIAPRGMMVLFGQSSGSVDPLDPQLLNRHGSLFLTRPTLGHYIAARSELLWRAKDLFSWVSRGELGVRIDSEFPLERVGEAHAALEGRTTKGKVILRVHHGADE